MLFHFVIFTKSESDFLYLFRFLSYGTIFAPHFLPKIAIFGHSLTHAQPKKAGIIEYAGDLSSNSYVWPTHQKLSHSEQFKVGNSWFVGDFWLKKPIFLQSLRYDVIFVNKGHMMKKSDPKHCSHG